MLAGDACPAFIGHADLAAGPDATDAPVARTPVHQGEGAHPPIGPGRVRPRRDAPRKAMDRPGQPATVADRFGADARHMRRGPFGMVPGSLPHPVGKERGPPGGIGGEIGRCRHVHSRCKQTGRRPADRPGTFRAALRQRNDPDQRNPAKRRPAGRSGPAGHPAGTGDSANFDMPPVSGHLAASARQE